MNKILIITIFITLAFYSNSNAQSDKVKFWANARGMQQNASLGKSDTVNVDKISSGYVLADLGVNINPLKNVEVQTIMRLRSELGGFYGGGSTVTLRRLNVKGLIANVLGYEVGDLYLKVSPYTLNNQNAEGSVNEASVFSNLRRDIINYDNFYVGNAWWQQGAHAYLSTGFKSGFIDKIKYDAFATRNRISPTMRLYAGGKVSFMSKDRFCLSVNYVNLFDDRAVTPVLSGLSNSVFSSDVTYKMVLGTTELIAAGEGGYSSLHYLNPLQGPKLNLSKTNYDDYFGDGNVGLNFNKKVKVKVGYRYVGADFISAGAQTKRINFASTPDMFLTVANNPFTRRRGLNLFDITRSTAVYNVAITPQLMAYDPTLSNAMPYGVATPNRQGVYGEVSWNDSTKAFGVTGKGYLMTDIVGVPNVSSSKRTFQVYQVSADLRLNQLFKWNKKFLVYGGAQLEKTKRSGNASAVDLTNTIVDAGLDLEVFKKFYVLGGAKMLITKGNEFISSVDQFNQALTPVVYNGKASQQLYGYGLKYDFNNNIYLTVQNQHFLFKDKLNGNNNYSFNQLFILFVMKL